MMREKENEGGVTTRGTRTSVPPKPLDQPPGNGEEKEEEEKALVKANK